MLARNKLAARRRLTEAGLAAPPFAAMGAAEDAPGVAEEVGRRPS
jgi:phosphoribosylaminoimidazole carboxylase (NCAIR synthetase)